MKVRDFLILYPSAGWVSIQSTNRFRTTEISGLIFEQMPRLEVINGATVFLSEFLGAAHAAVQIEPVSWVLQQRMGATACSTS